MTYVANPREHLVLAAARMAPPKPGHSYSRDASGKLLPMIQIDLYDIIAFDIAEDGHPLPITLQGRPDPMSGDVYAVFNQQGKTYTLLGGERLGDFRDFSAYVEKRDADAARWARGEAPDSPSQHANEGEPKPPTGEGGSAPGGAAIGGLAAPRPWKDVPRWGP